MNILGLLIDRGALCS